MTSWFHMMVEALRLEWQSNPIIAALATVDSNHHPHVRHVVCRFFQYEGNVIWITSDWRSAKNAHILENSHVELALWLPRRREQYRIKGTADAWSSELMWEELSPATRATFFWPTPGAPKSNGEFPVTIADDAKPPANFAVIMVDAIEAELLELSPHPHRRRRWKRAANWAVEELNP